MAETNEGQRSVVEGEKPVVESENRVVVIAVDGSDYSDNAFEYFMANSYAPNDHIIMVNSPEYHVTEYGSTILNDETALRASMAEEENRITQVLEKFGDKLRAKGVGGRVKSVAGKPGESVIQVANEENASLIVIGSRGSSMIRRTLLGSVSDYIIHHASCPVLVCRDKNAERQRRKSSVGASGERTRKKSIFNILIH